MEEWEILESFWSFTMVYNRKKKAHLTYLGILPRYISMSRYRSLRLRRAKCNSTIWKLCFSFHPCPSSEQESNFSDSFPTYYSWNIIHILVTYWPVHLLFCSVIITFIYVNVSVDLLTLVHVFMYMSCSLNFYPRFSKSSTKLIISSWYNIAI